MAIYVVCSGCHRDTITNQPHTQTSPGAWCERCWPREELAVLARRLITVMRGFASIHPMAAGDQEEGEFDPDYEGFDNYADVYYALDALDSRLIRLGG